MTTRNELKAGDRIKCKDADEAGTLAEALGLEGYQWDFEYHDGPSGREIYIIIEGRDMGQIEQARTTHKFTRYELDIIRMALNDLRKHCKNEQDHLTCWLLLDRLKREYDQQKEAEGEHQV